MPASVDAGHPDIASDQVALGRLLLTAVCVVGWLAVFSRVVSRVFVLNFSTAGPNATALLVLALVTGWTLPVAARTGTRSHPIWVVLAVLGVAASLVSNPVVAAIGGLVALAVLTQLLATLAQELDRRLAVGAGVGVVLHLAVRSGLDTAPMYATTAGQVGLVVLLIALVGIWWGTAFENEPETDYHVSVAPLAAFLFLEGTYLGAVQVLATWTLRALVPLALLSVVGLLAGAWWVETDRPLGRRFRLWLAVALVGSLGVLFWFDTAGLPFAFIAQFAAVVLLAVGSHRDGSRQPKAVGLELGATQFVAAVLVFLVVVATNWAFVPVVGPRLRGQTALLMLLLGALLPLVVLAGEPRYSGTSSVSPTRRRVLGLLGGSGALGVVGSLMLSRPDAAESAADTGGHLTVVSYNVHQFLAGDDSGEHNLVPLASVLASTDADIVGLQESEGARVTSGNVDGVRWLAKRLGYHYQYGAPTRRGGYGVALLSRWPIRDASVVSLPVHQSPPRWALFASIDAPFGWLPVAVTHFQTEKPGDRRLTEAQVINDWVKDQQTGTDPGRTVVLGDFNLVPDSGEYTVLTENLTDAWRAVDSPDPGYTWPAHAPVRRIDYVFTSGRIAVESVDTVGTAAVSDHLGVRADLRVE